jgi:hypothetical protein
MVPSTGRAPQQRRGIVGRIARSQGLVLPWCVALVLAVAVEVFAPVSHRWDWFAAAAGVAVIVKFLVQITIARADGFILRASTSESCHSSAPCSPHLAPASCSSPPISARAEGGVG